MQLTKGSKVRVSVPKWLVYQDQLYSGELEGTVEAVSAKGILFKGSALVLASQHCHRCGRTIINPISRLVGYGPECSGIVGIPRPEELDPEQIDEIRKRVAIKTEIQRWLPVSKCHIEVLGAAAPEPVQQAAPVAEETVTISAKGAGAWIIRSPFRYKDNCKAITGARWDKDARGWVVPQSPLTAKAIRAGFNGARIVAPQELLAMAAIDIQAAQADKEATELNQVLLTKRPAWLHQLRGYHFAKKLPAAMLAMDMGTGKSKVTVDYLCNQDIKTALIVCPSSVVPVWPKEFGKDAGVNVAVLPLQKGSVARRLKEAKQFLDVARASGSRAVIVINYESAWREPFATWATSRDWDLVVLDESHRIKAPGGVQSQYCSKLGKHARRRLCLTGTPMPHSPLDIYAQYRFLDPAVFGTSYVSFRNRYAIMGGYLGHQVRGYQNQGELNERFYSIAYRVGKEILDLPEAVHMERYCSLPDDVMETYSRLENDYYAEIEAGQITATNALVKLLRLQQLTSGYVITDDGQEAKVDDTKVKLMADVLEDIAQEEPVVVFCKFWHDLDACRAQLEDAGRTVSELSGRVNQLQEWQDGATNALVVQIQSGGVGIDLTRARYCIYFSKGYSLGDYLQSLARVHRPGQTRETFYIHLLASGTVDEDVTAALEKRQEVVSYVLDGIKARKGGGRNG